MLSEVDRKVLLIQYQCDPNASDDNIRKISIILGLPFSTVQTFFQNQRKFAKMRRAKRKEIQAQEKLRVEKAKEIYFKDLLKKQQNSQGEYSGASSGPSMASTQSSIKSSCRQEPPKTSSDRKLNIGVAEEDLTRKFEQMDTEDFEDPAIVVSVKTSTPERSRSSGNSLRDRFKYRQDVKAFKILNEISSIKPSTPLRNMKKVKEESLRTKKPAGYGKQGQIRRTLFGFI